MTESLKDENNLIFAQGLSLLELKNLNLGLNDKAELIDNMNDLKDRKTCKDLIFWSIPLSSNSLKLSLKDLKFKPKKVVFCGQNLKQEIDLKTFLRNLVNVLKNKALNILQESGILSFKIDDKNIKINLSGKPKKLKLNTQKLQANILAEHTIKQNLIQTPLHNLIH